MPCKRRNNGRSKKNRGHTRAITCSNCCRLVPKDKAIKKFTVKDIVDKSTMDDIVNKQTYKSYEFPKIYNKLIYCVSCAVHARIVRVRSVEDRRKRKKVFAPKEKKDEVKPKETVAAE